MARAVLFAVAATFILFIANRPFARAWGRVMASFSRRATPAISLGDPLDEVISARGDPIRKAHIRMVKLRRVAEAMLIPGFSFFLVGGILEEKTTAVLGATMWALSLASISLLRGADAIVTGVAYSSTFLAPVSHRSIVFDDEARSRGIRLLATGVLFLLTIMFGVVGYISLGP
jgi:hypothetical protein